MAYNWEGIEKIPWVTIQAMARDGKSLCGLFFLYDDNTETTRSSPGSLTWRSLVSDQQNAVLCPKAYPP